MTGTGPGKIGRWRERRRERRRAWKDWRRSRPGLLPRTFLGVALCALSLAVGAGVATVATTVWFQTRLDHMNASVDARLSNLARINGPDGGPVAGAAGNLTPTDESVLRLRTVSELGNPQLAEAFVASVDGDRVFLLTSLDAVRRATWDNEASLGVSGLAGGAETKAIIWNWDERSGLALLTAEMPGKARLDWHEGRLEAGEELDVPGSATKLRVESDNARNVEVAGDTAGVLAGTPLLSGGTVAGVVVGDGSAGSFSVVAPQRACERLFRCS